MMVTLRLQTTYNVFQAAPADNPETIVNQKRPRLHPDRARFVNRDALNRLHFSLHT
jgi:hypothetical protein